ncbi:MAG: SDR family NAD(P)-dependent oxidoreductase, partial [Burkholderiaceae bacterium]
MQRFSGKVVIVTGAGSGIGEATAMRFAEEGANVVLVGRTKEKLDKVKSALQQDKCLVQVADVSPQDEVEAMVRASLPRFARIDVLV